MDGEHKKRSPGGKRVAQIQSPQSAFKRVRVAGTSENCDGNSASATAKSPGKGKRPNKDIAGKGVPGNAKMPQRKRKNEREEKDLRCTEEMDEPSEVEAGSESEVEENSINGEQKEHGVEVDDERNGENESEDCKLINALKTYRRGKVDLTSKWFLLTFPACSSDPNTLLQGILRRYKEDISKAVAVREFHSCHRIWTENPELKKRLVHDVDSIDSGNCQVHVHILIGCKLNERRGLRIRSCRAFDVEEHHPNIRTVSVGTEGNVLDYIMKYYMNTTDEEKCILRRYGWMYELYRVQFPEDRMLFNRRGPGQTRITSELQLFLDMHEEGKTLKDITNEYPDMKAWIFNNGSKIVTYKRLVPAQINPPKAWTLPKGESAGSLSIIKWLSENIRTERQIRQKQLWITTPPGCGKSTFKNACCERLKCYLPPSEAFDTMFDDEVELIILDEFTGNQKSCEWIKSIADGSRYALKRKCLPDYVKSVNIPFIILSNYLPKDCPHWTIDSIQLRAIEDRFMIVSMSSYLPSF